MSQEKQAKLTFFIRQTRSSFYSATFLFLNMSNSFSLTSWVHPFDMSRSTSSPSSTLHSELYFLIARYLADGPCSRAASVRKYKNLRTLSLSPLLFLNSSFTPTDPWRVTTNYCHFFGSLGPCRRDWGERGKFLVFLITFLLLIFHVLFWFWFWDKILRLDSVS